MKKILTILFGCLASASVFAQTDSTVVDSVTTTEQQKTVTTTEQQETVTITDQQKVLNYVRSVYDKTVYVQNITTSIDLGLKGMGKSMNLDGRLQMRRNTVIRICIFAPFLGNEVARLEFTPTYVLLMDRWHGNYVKASYEQVPFLKAEGLDFYTLQSLFWNELFQPGKQKLRDSDLQNFTTDMSNPTEQIIRFKTSNILYRWNTDKNNQIIYAGMTYNYTDKKNYSTVMVNYGNFTSLGVKQFPKKLYVSFNSRTASIGSLSLNMDMRDISTDSDWEPLTNVPERYAKVSPEDFFNKLGSF